MEGASGASTTNIYVSGRAHHIEISRCEIRSSTQHGVYSDRTTRNLHIVGNSIHANGKAGQPHQNHGLYIEVRIICSPTTSCSTNATDGESRCTRLPTE